MVSESPGTSNAFMDAATHASSSGGGFSDRLDGTVVWANTPRADKTARMNTDFSASFIESPALRRRENDRGVTSDSLGRQAFSSSQPSAPGSSESRTMRSRQ